MMPIARSLTFIAVLTFVLALAPPTFASPERIAQEIRLTLTEMQRAVLAGDQPAYLACIDPADAIFFTEQQAWAADLARHLPHRFELALDEAALIESDGWVEAPLTMLWTMPAPDPAPEPALEVEAEQVDQTQSSPRQIRFTALFCSDPDLPGTWRFAGRKWSIVRGEGVRALCAPGLEEIGQMVVDVFPPMRQTVEAEFGARSSQSRPSRSTPPWPTCKPRST